MMITSDKTQNPGIVPPWLAQPVQPGRNPGIVPPWLSPTPVAPNSVAGAPTVFVREPIAAPSPTPGLIDALRSR